MESIDPRYDFDGSHAAPMLLSGDGADPALHARREHLADMFEYLAHEELNDRIGYDGAAFVAEDIRHRMSQREGQNSSSYMARGNKHFPNLIIPGHSPRKIWEAVKSAEQGQSTPLQSHLARRALRMGTSEDAQLTIIGNARRHLRQPMRDGVEELAGHDVDFGLESAYRISYLGTDTHLRDGKRPKLLRVGYKRKLSVLDDGAILKDRSTAILDVSDYHEFDPELIHYFQEIHKEKKPLASVPEFTKIVHNLIEGVIDTRFIAAENETIYEVDYAQLKKQTERIQRRSHRSNVWRGLFAPRPSQAEDKGYPVGDPRRQALEMYAHTTDTDSVTLLENLRNHGRH